MTVTPPLTPSIWIAGIVSRWKLVGAVALGAMTAAAMAVIVLPPVYQAHTTFIAPSSAGVSAQLAGESDASSVALRAALGSADAALESPLYYSKLLESEALRRRVLLSRFADPLSRAGSDSATLVEIMRIRASEPARRLEIASQRLERAMSFGFDLNTNVVGLDVRMPSADLAAAVTRRIVQVADEIAQEQRSVRARQRRLFTEARLDDARTGLSVAMERHRSFEEQNRLWRGSPELVTAEARLRRATLLAEASLMAQREELETARAQELGDRARTTVVDTAVPPTRALWPRYGQLLFNAILSSLLLGLIVAGFATFLSGRRQAAPEEPPPYQTGKKSALSRIAFPVFAWGLVFHSLLITVLFGLFGLSVDLVRSLAAWKEVGLAVLLAIVVLRAFTGRGSRTVLAWPDMWVGGLIATALMFLLLENPWLRFNLPRQAELLGFRDAVYFMLLYFIGRTMPELVSDEGAMRKVFILVLVTGVIGVIERTVVSPEMLVALGVAAYFQDFLGVSAFTVGNVYGLPLNYWTMIGGDLFRRAGSVYLSGQGFAVPFLILFPLATAWVFLRPSITRGQIIAYAIISTALVLTLTRMTILIALIQLVLFVSLRKRPEWAVAGLAVAGAVFLAAFAFIPGFPMFVWYTLSWQEGSSVSHVNDWMNGIAIFFQNPWGMGLGTADQTAVRAGLRHLTGDNLYLKYGVELGALGLSLFVLIIVSLGRSAMKVYRNGTTWAQKRMGITIWLAAIGISINGITAVVFNSITLGWLFFWLAGATVTVAQRLPDRAQATDPAT
ncbi:MAG: O-antigen ligase family protein [Gemmatimonadaceae bacterium]